MLYQCAATVKAKEEVAPCIYRFVFTLKDLSSISFTPGQYLLLQIPDGFRQYSISSAPSDTADIETIVDLTPMGVGSRYLLQLKLGDVVHFRAPAGIFTLKENSNPKILLATGTGITPLKSMLQHLAQQQPMPDSYLFWGLREKKDIYLTSVLNEISTRHPNFSYHICLSREEANGEPHHFNGRMQECIIAQITPEMAMRADWYLCGRPIVVEELVGFIQQQYAVPKDRFFHEKYT
ncbi:MAG: FAD-binding oxidoreductase [Candidatus Roizmanbacteria bacterium]|nr:FAD-binding oxidoreductase [Candidatus Roizmanbacteria bacterium]